MSRQEQIDRILKRIEEWQEINDYGDLTELEEMNFENLVEALVDAGCRFNDGFEIVETLEKKIGVVYRIKPKEYKERGTLPFSSPFV